ncbi:hypothetical protein [Flavivirga rizhaonensis]|uniref:Uncharacterized protein n=1 Tax=Flavivirga rizhaonensis TaxID=2559571 RepID=A0A4S1E2K4_9FLAO|nr:hypothetical protein [Flavivirga rizhaonensis]TGV04583.1 hypothetical protein EM932_00190 [Flavivirga rizhaonensis]
MKANIILFTLFDFDQNTNNNRDNITKIIDDIAVTLSGCSRLELSPGSIRGEAPNLTSVGLNCINAMSFTVKESAIEYDDLSVNSFQQTWSNDNDPNSVSYMLHIKDVSGLKFIRVYNNLRQKVLQIKGIDASHLTKGLYFFKYLRFSRL